MHYENRIVAFVDILGFSNLVKDSYAGNIENQSVTNNIHSFIHQMLDDFIKERSFNSMVATQFSDSIVISYKMDEESAVFNLLLSIMFLICDAMKHNLLLRGGVSVGPLCHNKHELFGPAMIKAYNLESSCACYPRIILSDEVIDLAREYHASHHKPEQELEYVENLLQKDFDGYYFVDYFEAPNGNFDENDCDYFLYLNNIRKVITDNLKIKDERVLQKMRWMISYYNKALENMKTYSRDDFSVDYQEVYDLYQNEKAL